MSYATAHRVVKTDQDTAGASTTTHGAIAAGGAFVDARRWRLQKILASYGTSTQGGTVTITGLDGGTMVVDFVGRLDLDFGAAGLRSLPGVAIVVTQSAGAAAVVSNLTSIAFAEGS